jgi:hypothetical protein
LFWEVRRWKQEVGSGKEVGIEDWGDNVIKLRNFVDDFVIPRNEEWQQN